MRSVHPGGLKANLDGQAQDEHRSDRYQQAIAENTVTGATSVGIDS